MIPLIDCRDGLPASETLRALIPWDGSHGCYGGERLMAADTLLGQFLVRVVGTDHPIEGEHLYIAPAAVLSLDAPMPAFPSCGGAKALVVRRALRLRWSDPIIELAELVEVQ